MTDIRHKITKKIILACFIGVVGVIFTPHQAEALWWNSSWNYKFSVSSTPSLVDITTSSFPLLIDLSQAPAGFWTNVQADGDDIRITSSTENGTLAYELVNISTASSTGELWFNTGANGISSTTASVFYVYYGNAGASAGEDLDNTWQSHYTFVAHFEATSTESSGTTFRPKVTIGSQVTNPQTGAANGVPALGGYYDFTAANDGNTFLSYGSVPQTVVENWTMSAWCNSDTTSVNSGCYFNGSETGPTYGYGLGYGGINGSVNGDNIFVVMIGVSAWTDTTANISDYGADTWVHSVISRDTDNVQAYFNGVKKLDGAIADPSAPAERLSVGDLWDGVNWSDNYNWPGRVDELRVMDTKFPSEWIVTEYNNMNATSTFWTFGAQESAPAEAAAPARRITPYIIN